MKIAVSAVKQDLNAEIDSRFGRCACFLIIDTEKMTVSAFENSQRTAPGGAGTGSAQFIINQKVDTLITGNVGPKAEMVLNASSVKVFTGKFGPVKDGVSQIAGNHLKTDELKFQKIDQPTVEEKGFERHRFPTGGICRDGGSGIGCNCRKAGRHGRRCDNP